MDYKKLICRRILDLDPQYDIKKLENSSKGISKGEGAA